MIVAAIATLVALAGMGLVHEVHTMDPARRMIGGHSAHPGRRGGHDPSSALPLEVSTVPSIDAAVGVTAASGDGATFGER